MAVFKVNLGQHIEFTAVLHYRLEVIDRVIVQNNPVNFVDPWGLHARDFSHSHSGRDTGDYGHANKLTGNITFDKAYDELNPTNQQTVDYHENYHLDHPFSSEEKVWAKEIEYMKDLLDKLPPDDPNRQTLEKWLDHNERNWDKEYGQKNCN